MRATANPSQGHTVWMDISAKTSPGHISLIPYERTQPAGTDHLSKEISKVWVAPLCQLYQHGSVKEKGQDLAGLSSSVPTLQLCIPASWSSASSPRNCKGCSWEEVTGWEHLQQPKNASSRASPLTSGTHLHAMPLHLEVASATQNLVHNPDQGRDVLNSFGV